MCEHRLCTFCCSLLYVYLSREREREEGREGRGACVKKVWVYYDFGGKT